MPVRYKTKLTHKVALRKLEQAVERAVYWNEHYSEFYHIEDMTLVGSMARGEQRVGDIDLCIKVDRAKKFSPMDSMDEYIQWRLDELGYAPPRDFDGLLDMFERDVKRFIKNRDGRIEALLWIELDFISLNMRPIVPLIKDGELVVQSVAEAITNAKPISMERAKKIISNGMPNNPRTTTGEYWDIYCETLGIYPECIRKLVLERDSYTDVYFSQMNA